MSLKKQLDRYKKHLKQPGHVEKETTPRVSLTDIQLEKSMKEAAGQLGASILTHEQEAILVKEQRVSLQEKYGRYPLADIHEAVAMWQNDLVEHPLSAAGRKASDLLFFDTETTGLQSGAGHMIFLLGCGWIQGEDFVVKQYFLPGPGHETAFYYHFLKDVTDLTNLVTFNGKSFDWPRVKTRVQFVRERVPMLPAFGHYDLLHASRRLWKEDWENVRLQTIEEKVLELGRAGDVPGHMAPFLYFQFLKSPKASLIEGIFKHNYDDIKTLLVLYIHLTHLLHGKNVQRTPKESYAIAHWFASLGMTREAIIVLRALTDTDTNHDKSRAGAYQLLGECYKKLGENDLALQYYHYVVGELDYPSVNSCIEIAKILEHQKQDYEQAMYYGEKALEILDKKKIINKGKYHKMRAEVLHRLARLQHKSK
ncbi:uncharacterized protein YprB with RNaseH-like and TPR domain [Pullulanibacillus pueri]|nr:ribonuclease H-like domain-containing protein [Pullulanibacillus pueri]MBM7680999.1 uncharacterized protein YprB with RNaseH-like and TPR domain [Pullulanibacillus pueri]